MRPKTMAKKVRGSHRGDLTTVRNRAIVRSVAIDRASYEHRSKLLVNSRITGKWRLSGLQVSCPAKSR